MKKLSEKIEKSKQVAKDYEQEITIRAKKSNAFPNQTIVQVYPKKAFINLGFLAELGKVLGDPFPTIEAPRKDKLLIEYWIEEAD